MEAPQGDMYYIRLDVLKKTISCCVQNAPHCKGVCRICGELPVCKRRTDCAASRVSTVGFMPRYSRCGAQIFSHLGSKVLPLHQLRLLLAQNAAVWAALGSQSERRLEKFDCPSYRVCKTRRSGCRNDTHCKARRLVREISYEFRGISFPVAISKSCLRWLRTPRMAAPIRNLVAEGRTGYLRQHRPRGYALAPHV